MAWEKLSGENYILRWQEKELERLRKLKEEKKIGEEMRKMKIERKRKEDEEIVELVNTYFADKGKEKRLFESLEE